MGESSGQAHPMPRRESAAVWAGVQSAPVDSRGIRVIRVGDFDRRLGRHVAIKRLRSDLDAPSARERFRREARATARLGHSSIVQVFDLVETDQGDWIVMELVEGCDGAGSDVGLRVRHLPVASHAPVRVPVRPRAQLS